MKPPLLCLCLASLSIAVACSSKASDVPTGGDGQLARGEQLFASAGCVLCHGPKGEGSMMGPKLENLSAHWDAAGIAGFLVNPAAALKTDARLAQQAAKYPQAMTPQASMPEADRLALAAWLLR